MQELQIDVVIIQYAERSIYFCEKGTLYFSLFRYRIHYFATHSLPEHVTQSQRNHAQHWLNQVYLGHWTFYHPIR